MKKSFKIIRKEIIKNWKKNHNFLGIKRFRLESLSSASRFKTRKVIALMRRNKEIILYRTNYFINLKRINNGK